jgi:hypothetical protein
MVPHICTTYYMSVRNFRNTEKVTITYIVQNEVNGEDYVRQPAVKRVEFLIRK